MRTLDALGNLSGRVAVVTGGAGHLGQALCEALAEKGARVVVVDREQEECERHAQQLNAGGGRALALACDLSSREQTGRLAGTVIERTGRLDILVNNAAYTGMTGLAGWGVSFSEQSLDAWEAALRVNLTAAFQLAQSARGALEASGHGVIVNVGSIYGEVGPDPGLYQGTSMANPAGYGASKGGLLQLTRYLSTVLAPAVRVNALSPGGIERGQPAVFQQRYRDRTPLGRMAHEEDLKGALWYLASDLSAYVTGQNLVVDGGWTAW